MIFSILAYLTAALVLYGCGKLAIQTTIIRHKDADMGLERYLPVVLALIFFSLFYGLRSKLTGVDTETYYTFFDYFSRTGSFMRDNIEIGYKILLEKFVNIGLPRWSFIGFFGFLELLFIYLATWKHKYLWPYIGLYVILGPVFLEWANIMRQAVVQSVFLFAFKYIEERKLVKYVIIIAVCSLLHTSAWILIPIYWLVRIPCYPHSGFIRVILFVGCIIIGNVPSWMTSVQFIGDILAFGGYDWYSENLEMLSERSREMSWGPARVTIAISWLWMIIALPNAIRKLKFPNQYDDYFKIFFIGVCLYNLFVNTSEIFLRPIAYFKTSAIILAPLLFYYYIKMKKELGIIILAILIFNYSIWGSIKGAMTSTASTPSRELYSISFLDKD